MKKLLMVLFAAGMLSCGDSRQSGDENRAGEQERIDEGSGEEISPQLVPDDSLEDSRYDVDTLNTGEETERGHRRGAEDLETDNQN